MGGGGGGTSTTTQQTQLPSWVEEAARSNYNYAETDVAKNLMSPYTGQRVANMTPEQLKNIGSAQTNVGSTNDPYNRAETATSNFLNYQAPQVSAQMLSQTDLNPYMNPFTGQVIQGGLQALDMQRQGAINQGAATAAQSRAFGGSRQGVQEGITNAGAAYQAGQLYSGLQSQNFMQAQQAAQGDIQRQYQAQLANQGANIQSANLSLGAANQLGNLAGQGQQSYLQGLAAAQGAQGQLQQQQQDQLSAAQQYYAEQRQMPIDILNIRQNALKLSPYGQTVTGQAPGPSSNGLQQGLGTAAAVVGMAGSIAAIV